MRIKTKESVENQLPYVGLAYEGLPSKGIPYPKGSSIHHRPYTYGETIRVSKSKLDKVSSILFVLEGIEVGGMDKMDITLGDFLFITVLRRISTLGDSKANAKSYCTSCGNVLEITVDTKELEFDELDVPKVPLTAKLSKHELKFSPLTVGAYIELIKRDAVTDDIALMAAQCVNMKPVDAYATIDTCTPQDGDILKLVEKKMYHSMAPLIVTCESEIGPDDNKVRCGYKNRVELDGGQALLLPFRERTDSLEDRISFE